MKRNYYQKVHLKFLLYIFAGFLLVLAVWLIMFRIVKQDGTQPTSIESSKKSVIGHYLFNGTIFWGRGIEKWSLNPAGGHNYAKPFSGLDSFNRKQYDAWEADLECPVTNNNVSFETQVSNLVFNCRPEYLPEAAKYFNLINLANNHTDNQGRTGFAETQSHLAESGIQYFGDYDPSVTENTCEVVSMPVRIVSSDGNEEPGNLPVAICAWHYFYREPKTEELQQINRYAAVMPVFAFVHMGTEYNKQAKPDQMDIAHQVIDLGAEFVIANNPHWVQNSEAYKGRLIVYSTGNFIFDQLDSEGMRSVSIDTTMTASYDDNISRWLALGEKCKEYHDTCLEQAKKQMLAKPNIQLKYLPIAGDNSNRLTKKGSAILQQEIEQRLGWSGTLKELK